MAFGSTVLVPLLVGIDPSVALFTAGLFPPIVVDPVIMLIGLSLAGAGVNMAKSNWLLTIIALVATIIVSMFGKGLLKLIPIVTGIIVGYVAAIIFGVIDFQPKAVLGGIMLLLFGTIAAVGINSLVKNKVDLGDTRNLIIASLILTLGIGGAELTFGSFTIGGIGLAALVGVALNLILPRCKSKQEA